MPGKKRRRWGRLLALLLLVAAGCLGQPLALLFTAHWNDRPSKYAYPPGKVDDASRLNQTAVAEVVPIATEPHEAESQLRDLLKRAAREKKKVAIAGARHSMGGHTIYPNGIVLDMLPFHRLELDAKRKILRAGAGARWSEIIPFLDARGLSVAIMQSNNDFSVGGSISVNCHGWQHNCPPIASTVDGFRLMQANGQVVRCSRTENAELFGLALGGYGLFGVILDVDLRVVPNARYRPEPEIVPIDRYVTRFAERVNQTDDAGMVYGRLCVVPGKMFLREALVTLFRVVPSPTGELPPLQSAGYSSLRREIYRSQIGSQAGKALRWRTEKIVSSRLKGQYFSRNQLLNEPVAVYQEQNADRTDILHEYFIPPEQFTKFLDRVREIVPRHDLDLMNVTVRNIFQDKDTFLRYADRDMFAFVMLFNQARTTEADDKMRAGTEELIDAALACDGRYYLPYRLHATPKQFHQAYPQATAFFARKKVLDPLELFQNQFYLTYGK